LQVEGDPPAADPAMNHPVPISSSFLPMTSVNRGNAVAELTTMQSIGVTGGLKYMLYVRDLIALLLNNPVRVELAYTTVGMVISRFGHNNLPELISS